MLKEIAGISREDKAVMVAFALIEARVRELSKDDRNDLMEVLRVYITAAEDEDRESAAQAIAEIMEGPKGKVRAMKLPSGVPTQWTRYISQKIRELRSAAGLTQEQLAEKSGLTQSHICRLEKGEHSPNGLTLEKIAKGLGVTVSKLDPSASELK